MKLKSKLSLELKTALEKWAEERLECIGVYKDKASDFEGLKDKLIKDLRSVYSDKAIDLFLRPKNRTIIQSPDGFARITGPCGDTMGMYLKIKKGRITRATFQTDGCDPSIASGGMVVEMVTGMRIEDTKKITQQDISVALEGLPEDSLHCALLAANTLKEAIRNLEKV